MLYVIRYGLDYRTEGVFTSIHQALAWAAMYIPAWVAWEIVNLGSRQSVPLAVLAN